MQGYVDVYLLPLPKKNVAKYRRMANVFAKVVADHGALEYREFIGDDLVIPQIGSFTKLLKPKPGETLVTSVVGFRSKVHRNKVNKAVMSDARLVRFMKRKPPFDMKRMYMGGFKTFIKM